MQQHREGVPLLSVVMTAHNAETLLPQTLQSLAEAIDGDDCIEVVIVNDSSQDNTHAVIQQYLPRFPVWLSYVVDYTNVGKTKNFGLQQCRGQYVTFVDDDDLFRRYSLTNITEYLQCHQPDMLLTPVNKQVRQVAEAQQQPRRREETSVDARAWSQHKAITALLQDRDIKSYMVGKFIKRDIYNQSVIRPFTCFEDLSVMPDIFMQCQDIHYWDVPVYYYVTREGSLMSGFQHDRKKARLRLECIKIAEQRFPARYLPLIACQYIDLHLRHRELFDDDDLMYLQERMRTLTDIRFFLSPSVRISFKRKAIQELKRARKSPV